MAIADLSKVEVVLPKVNVDSVLSALEQSGLLHVDDIHLSLSEDLAQEEAEQPHSVSGATGHQADVDFLLQLFQRFAPTKKGLLEEFFGSPPPRTRDDLNDLLGSVDVTNLRAQLSNELSRYDQLIAEQTMLRQHQTNLEPWRELELGLDDLRNGRHIKFLPVKITGSQDVIIAAVRDRDLGSKTTLTTVSTDKNMSYCIIIVLANEFAEAQNGLRQLSADLVDLPVDSRRPAVIIAEATDRLVKIAEMLNKIESDFVTAAKRYRSAVLAHADAAAGNRAQHEARRRLFYSKRSAVMVGWVRTEHVDPLRMVLEETCPTARARFSAPDSRDDPPVDLANRTLIRPFEFLIRMFGMPKYFGIDPTPFVAVAMTLFYALALGDAGYGLLQVLLSLWLMRRYQSAGETRLFLRMFVITGIASIVVGVLTWSFFGASPGVDPNIGNKIFGVLPLLTPSRDIVALMGFSIGVGVVFQLSSIVAGLINVWKLGKPLDAVMENGSWLALLVAMILWLVVRVAGFDSLEVPTTVILSVTAVVVVVFGIRQGGRIGRILAGIVSLYGIVGYYGLVGFFSDVLSYMRLGILSLTSAFIGQVGNLMGGLFFGAEGGLALVVGALIGSLIVVMFHLLNLVLSMLGAFVHSLRLNYLESFQRYFDAGGRAFTPLRGDSKHYRITNTVVT